MTTPDELERLAEARARLLGLVCAADECEVHCAFDRLLSERAELLAAVERMRKALERIAQPEYGIGFNRLRGIARAALTTGEEK